MKRYHDLPPHVHPKDDSCSDHFDPELTVRNAQCPRCNKKFAICKRCDRGHVYCSKECSEQARQESKRRARKKYRRSPEGREDHRDRERERRAHTRDYYPPKRGMGDHRRIDEEEPVGSSQTPKTEKEPPPQRGELPPGPRDTLNDPPMRRRKRWLCCSFCGRWGRPIRKRR